MLVNGGDIETASVSDYLLHFITFGLKVVVSFVFFIMIMMARRSLMPLSKAVMIMLMVMIMITSTKVLFATAPPPGKGSGWPCFWVSLVYIGICACVIRSNPHNSSTSFLSSIL